MLTETVCDFGNLPWSHAEALAHAAKKGGRVHYDAEHKVWQVIRKDKPQGWTDEDAAWGCKA